MGTELFAKHNEIVWMGDLNLPHINWVVPVPTSDDQVYPYFLAKLQEHGMQQCNLAPTRAANVLDLVISNISD